MRVELTGRHTEVTPTLRRLVEKRLARLDRVLNDSALSAQVVLTHEKRGRRADVTLHARGEKFFHGDGFSNVWETALIKAVDKIAQQAKKVKGKWEEWKRRGAKGRRRVAEREEGLEPARAPARPSRVRPRIPRIFRTAREAVKPMSVAQAAREVEANGEGVVVFRDVETAAISVLYRRTNGELVLVETES